MELAPRSSHRVLLWSTIRASIGQFGQFGQFAQLARPFFGTINLHELATRDTGVATSESFEITVNIKSIFVVLGKIG